MSAKTRRTRKVLLFGGGAVHDWRKACPILRRYLVAIDGFAVDYVKEDYDVFLAERIAHYDLAVLYHTCGELTSARKTGLLEWLAGGKGLVGVHGAADSFTASPDYVAMIGGVFRAHPFLREYVVSLADTKHPVTRGIEGRVVKHWEKWPVYEYPVVDEQYLVDYDPRIHVLASAIFRGKAWPVAWTKGWGKGKVFYLALGHNPQACRSSFFRDLLIGGAVWAADGKRYAEPPTKAFAIG
ncbi:MAG: ThuA domain-containing protein [Planctomycetota bacterium]